MLNVFTSVCVLILLSVFWVSVDHSSLLPALFLAWLSLQLAMATVTLHVAELSIAAAYSQKHLLLPYGLWEQLGLLCFRLHSWGGSVPFVSHLPTGLSMFSWQMQKFRGTNENTQNLFSWPSGGTRSLLRTCQ